MLVCFGVARYMKLFHSPRERMAKTSMPPWRVSKNFKTDYGNVTLILRQHIFEMYILCVHI